MKYDLQSTTLTPNNLLGICAIRRYESEDEIYLGTTLLGEILEMPDTEAPFDGAKNLYVFKSIMGNVYPRRASYLECWFDILIEIANDSELAIEFAVLAQRKTAKSNDTVTPLDKTDELF